MGYICVCSGKEKLRCYSLLFSLEFSMLIISNMPPPVLLPILLFLTLSAVRAQECLEYQAGTCLRCVPNLVLLKGVCVGRIPGCVRYVNGSVCAECNSTLFALRGGDCVLIENQMLLQGNVTLYELAAFGDYQAIPLEQLPSDGGFVRCDRMLRSGEYKHFISQSVQPVFFAAYSQLQSWRNYELIYQASGGGLLLCLVNYDAASQAVAIQSIVSIATAQLVEHCLSYTPALECNYCRQGYHLDRGRCDQDIGGCSSYHGNICLACGGYLLLVENRCIGDCGELCDTAKIRFFQNCP